MIPVLGSQPASDISHKPGGRLPLLSTMPAVTFPAKFKLQHSVQNGLQFVLGNILPQCDLLYWVFWSSDVSCSVLLTQTWLWV